MSMNSNSSKLHISPRKLESNTSDRSIECSSRHSISNTSLSQITILPSASQEVPLSVKFSEILDLFSLTALSHRFHKTEQSSNSMVVTLQPGFSLLSLLKCCLPVEDSELVTSVSVLTKISQKKCAREVHIKTLGGDPFTSAALIESFVLKLSALSSSNQEVEEEEDLIVTCKQEATSYYEFCKILSCEDYSLGKSVSDFVQSFQSSYRNSEESAGLLPQPTDSLKNKVEEIVLALFSDFNYGRKSAGKIMVHCRAAVEKFLFSKIGTTLQDAYKSCYENNDVLISQQRERLRNLNLFKEFEIKVHASYQLSIAQVNRLNNANSPHDKIKCLMTAISEAKSEVLEYTHGHYELASFEEHAVLAFAVVWSDLQAPTCELMLLKDWYKDEEAINLFEDALHLINSI